MLGGSHTQRDLALLVLMFRTSHAGEKGEDGALVEPVQTFHAEGITAMFWLHWEWIQSFSATERGSARCGACSPA
jgi:hypothetical protein